MKVIYTKHAQARIKKRHLSQTSIVQTITKPDKTYDLGQQKIKFIALQGQKCYHVVAQYQKKEKIWLVVSAWIRGEADQNDWLWLLLKLSGRFFLNLCWWLGRQILSLLKCLDRLLSRK